MSLRQQATRELDGWGTFHGPPRMLDIEDSGERVRCELTALDVLGCAFERLSLESPRLAAASIDDLKAISALLAARLTYLLEPISPIEIDADRCVVQLRSNPPQTDEQNTSPGLRHAGSLAAPDRRLRPSGELLGTLVTSVV
ncbi:MAG: hypothetical protein HY000_25295 [Planctomycetes bacterium]|nr:hypothetical protein [Planctomycetota bacterium]